MPNQPAANKLLFTCMMTYDEKDKLREISDLVANGNMSETIRIFINRFGAVLLENKEKDSEVLMEHDREILKDLKVI